MRDPRLEDLPSADPPIRFLAAAPLTWERGVRLGWLVLSDAAPRAPDDSLPALLQSVADSATAAVVQHSAHRRLQAVESALDQSEHAVAILEEGPLDAPGPCIEHVNRAFTQITGYTYDEAVGAALTFLEGDDTDQRLSDKLQRAVEDKRDTVRFRTLNYRKGGSAYVVEWCVTAVRDGSGSIANWIAVQRDLTSSQDVLTGLESRDLFVYYLDRALSSGMSPPPAVLYVGIEDLRGLSQLGFTDRDEVLQALAQRLQTAARQHAVVTRLEGDNFGVLLPQASASDATQHAAHLLQRLSEALHVDRCPVRPMAFLGIARPAPGTKTDAETLLRQARAAHKHVRDQSTPSMQAQARSALFRPAMLQQRQSQNALEEDLRRAIDAEEIVPHFQPILSIEDGTLRGFEALMRWQHPQRGKLQPQAFIGVALQHGLLPRIDRQMIRAVARHMQAWTTQRGPLARELVTTINISALSFQAPGLAAHIQDTVAAIGLDPSCLAIEVTEQALIRNESVARAELQRLREHGVRICIDDFGTKYASFQLLRNLPVQTIKVDRSFIHSLTEDRSAAAIVEAVRDLAAALDLSVVAEGVETSDQLRRLQALGCAAWCVQGFLFERPVPRDEAASFIGGPAPWHELWAL
jgi:PAS domain S-box-containing protein/diguanylate cyclase (GGDEF)-like protein